MIKKTLKDFDIEQIANSGQCFRIRQLEQNTWKVIAFNKILNIRKLNREEYIFECSEEEFKSTWFDYFDLQTDYQVIKKDILNLNDPYLSNAVNYGYGIRILRQDLWEMIISYIISQRNSIKRISNTIEKLCEPFSGRFPSPVELETFSLNDFKNLGLGYRAEYLVEIVKSAVSKKLDLEALKTMTTENALSYLKQFKGIGPKVANCIALYGLYKTDAFPIDTWIKRIIETQYNNNLEIDRFKSYAGIVQQYMFFYQRFLAKAAL